MRMLLLGLDIGSSVVKAVVFDRRGRVVAAAAQPAPPRPVRPGWVERDAERTWRIAAAVIRRAVRGRAGAIAAVGPTGCGNGAVFVDARRRPLRPGILSSDTRAARFMARPDPRRGQRPYPGQLRSLLAWFRAAEPERARRMAHVLCWKDFVRARLTGVVAMDFTDAGAAGLLAYPGRTWRQRDQALPALRESTAPAGQVTQEAARATGLRAGTPVFTGCLDCEAAAIGSGVGRPGEVSVVAGTWSINQAFVVRPPRPNAHFLVNPSAIPGRWLVLEGSPSSTGNFDWAVRVLGGGGAPGKAAAAAARAAAGGDLLFVPHVPAGGGAWAGLALGHGRPELLRAVMEGIVFAHRAHLEALAVTTGPVRRVTLTGGATRSGFWCQLFADGLGCPVDVPAVAEPGAWGAALCAGIGAGLWRSWESAQRSAAGAGRRYHPQPAGRAAMERNWIRYQRLIEHVSP